MLCPRDVHFGGAEHVLRQRQVVLDAAYSAHPERFTKGLPIVAMLSDAVYINPPEHTRDAH